MNTVTKYSVSDAATLYKKSRATLYKDIKNGTLSRDHDGFIDFSELLRVYGEPFIHNQPKRIDTYSRQNQNTSEYTDKTLIDLKSQIDFLKKQLEKAEDREAQANARIDTLLTLIEMKSPLQNTATSTDKKFEPDIAPSIDPEVDIAVPEEKIASTPESIENQNIPVSKHIEEKPKRRGLLGRLAKAIFDD